ncbi:hypothetical protein TNCV_5111411 [Trichonephila clavipes]|nr:hypothetical protein TNCV_5111411 [Trichonephila clavipes]
MSGHENQRAPEDAMQLGTEIPPAALAPANLQTDDFIEIETFDKDCTDASQLSALIKEKANTELEYATALGELKVLYPCPVKSCQHNKGNGINSFRPKNKRPAESPILPATLILENKNLKNQEDAIIPTKNSFTSLAIDDPVDNAIESENPMQEDNPESNGTTENEDVTVTLKVKPIMLKYKTNYNLILKELD